VNWKIAGKKRFWSKGNFPDFYREVRSLKENQDNGCSGRD